VENLTFAGVGDSTVTGNALANLLIGGAGNDSLTALDGNDTLDGGTGADHLAGGNGNDLYKVDNAGDQVIEAGGAGTDTVLATLNNYTLAANVENLTFAGAGDFTATGNGLTNSIAGGTGDDALDGSDGNDTLDAARVMTASPVESEMTPLSSIAPMTLLTRLPAREPIPSRQPSQPHADGQCRSSDLYGCVGFLWDWGMMSSNTLTGGNARIRWTAASKRQDHGRSWRRSAHWRNGQRFSHGSSGRRHRDGRRRSRSFLSLRPSRFTSGATLDLIADFSTRKATRSIFRRSMPIPSLPGNQAFTFIGTAAFSAHAGELHYAVTAPM
jgi:Ca2+-binding RTX toxin-like protein